jgi:hypothetical protein
MMSFLKTTTYEDARDDVKRLYDYDLETKGYIANYSSLFSLRPEVLDAWRNLQGAIRKNMRLRRYELVTFAAATALHCSY